MTTYFFGPRWDAPMLDDGNARRIETPVEECCADCDEHIDALDRGILITVLERDPDGRMRADVAPIHMECQLRGVLSHFHRQCACYVQHASRRDEARATLAAVDADRALAGLGPM